jgi:hypothetical protein
LVVGGGLLLLAPLIPARATPLLIVGAAILGLLAAYLRPRREDPP